MDPEEQQQKEDWIANDPKIKQLQERIKEAKMREKIREAASLPQSQGQIPPLDVETKTVPDEPAISAIHTYEADATEAIKAKKPSLLSIKLAESAKAENSVALGTEKKEAFPEFETIGTAGRAIGVYVSIILICGGLSALILIYYLNRNRAPQPPVIETTSIIRADASKEVGITSSKPEEVLALLNKSISAEAQPLSIVRFLLKKSNRGISAKEFLTLVAPSAPASLIRALDQDFAIGFYNGSIPEPFIILKVTDYENSYAGMLGWENKMPTELGPFISDGGSLAAETASASSGSFEDLIVVSRDTRVSRNEIGQSVVIYSFVDKNTILITRDEEAFKEIISKLIASKFVR